MNTGKPVNMSAGHTLVTGMTQDSGKTTTLTALVGRGELTALTFLTKRGEKGFAGQREIQPYYKEQVNMAGFVDWRFVESILEATIGEKMKLVRSFIIRACETAKNLQDVYDNLRESLENAKRGFDRDMLTNLDAYFKMILPEIKKHKFSKYLSLRKGFNVMNLIEMPDQMQQLVIRSSIRYVYENLENTVVVLPEAHKFIPPSNTPVKSVALLLAKEGATLGNYLWLDSQDTTSLDKQVLKQCSNWIMGYQQEKNEVNNVREHLGKRFDADLINSLKLGHYAVSLKRRNYHLYVLPYGIDPMLGKDVALGRKTPEAIRNILQGQKMDEDEEMYKQKAEELKKELETLKKEKGDVVALKLDLEKINKENKKLKEEKEKAEEASMLAKSALKDLK
ncbi:MAG: hypothetical protein ACTSPB_14555, partial [Candidatus Thorarchaeota archaeon]